MSRTDRIFDLFEHWDEQYNTYDVLTPATLRNSMEELFRQERTGPCLTESAEMHIDDWCELSRQTREEALEDLRNNPLATGSENEEWWRVWFQ